MAITGDGPLVALPPAAADQWPGAPAEGVLDTMGSTTVDVILSRVPAVALVEYNEEEFTEAQLEAFWGDDSHVHFGLDAGGNYPWPDWAEYSRRERSVSGCAPPGGRSRTWLEPKKNQRPSGEI